MTPLTKPIHRVVVIDDQEYIASLVPANDDTPDSFTLRKKKHRSLSACVAMEDTLTNHEDKSEPKPFTQAERSAQHIAKRIKVQSIEDGARENDKIHPDDLKMWAKYSYTKFNHAWKKYQLLSKLDPDTIIFWGKENSIEVETDGSWAN